MAAKKSDSACFADIGRQLTEQIKQTRITRQIKAEKALEWVQRINNIRACAKEIIEKEIIFA